MSPKSTFMLRDVADLVKQGEGPVLEFKRSSGELKEGMRTLCAFYHSSLKIFTILCRILLCLSIIIWVLSTAIAVDGVSQQTTEGSEDHRNTTNDIPSLISMTNMTIKVSLAERLNGPPKDVLLRNRFQEKENGFLSCTGMSLGEAKKLLCFETKDMKPVKSCPPSRSSYWVDFGDAYCVIDIYRNIKETNSIQDDHAIINLTVNTNAIPPGRKLTPRQTSAGMKKSEGMNKDAQQANNGKSLAYPTNGLPAMNRRSR